MRTAITCEHWNDANGNPAGGNAFGPGFAIGWQHGPLGRHVPGPAGCAVQSIPRHGQGCVAGCTRRAQNGAFVEDVIEAAADRLRYYQSGRFACDENATALAHIEAALRVLDGRTKSRESRQVEGTHQQ